MEPVDRPGEGHVAFANDRETDLAVAVSRQAFESWRGTPLSRRAEVMFKLRELVDANRRRIAELITSDLAMAADAAISAAYGSAGERCMAISVLVAVGNIADPLVSALRDRIYKIKVGPGIEESNDMGPLVTRELRDRVASFVEGAPAEGASIAVDGRENPVSKREGFFLGASLLDHVRPGMRCYSEEIFGPVLSVVRVDTYADAIGIINENPYGNGAAIFTRDGGAAQQFQFDVEAGMVGVNVPIPVPVAYYSFGGWKDSLFGDLHMYGPEGVQFYTRAKVVTSLLFLKFLYTS